MEKDNNKNGALKTVSTVMLIMLVGKVTGLFRQLLLAAYLGSSIDANAFNAASTIPNRFLDFTFAAAISSSFIPIFNSYLENKNKKEAFKLANNFITIILLFSTILTAVLMIFSRQLTYLFAFGFEENVRQLTTEILLIMLPTIVTSALAFSVTGILQSLDEFNVPAAMSIVSNVIIIIYTLFFIDKFPIHMLAVVFLIGWGSQFLIQIPSLIKKGYRYRPYINFKDEGIRQIGKMAVPVMLSSWILPINSMVNSNAASFLFDGKGTGVTAIHYAHNLYEVITGVLILSISNVLFPKLSKIIAKNDEVAFGKTLNTTLCGMLFLLIPMTGGLLVLSDALVNTFYAYKNVDAFLAGLISQSLAYHAVGMIGFGLQNLLSRGFFAIRNTKVPFYTGIVAIVVNAIVSFSLVGVLGVGGPSLASAVSMTVTGLLMLFLMKKENKNIMPKESVINILKMFFAAVIMSVGVYFIFGLTSNFIGEVSFLQRIIKLLISVCGGVVIYMVISFVIKVKEARFVFDGIKKFIKR